MHCHGGTIRKPKIDKIRWEKRHGFGWYSDLQVQNTVFNVNQITGDR